MATLWLFQHMGNRVRSRWSNAMGQPSGIHLRVSWRGPFVTVLWFCASLLLAAGPSLAAEPQHLVRLYYAPSFTGVVNLSPADPNGAYTAEKVDRANMGEFEVMLWRRLGLSAMRHSFAREYTNRQNQNIWEYGVSLSLNATVYLARSEHDAWNLFAGYGEGVVEQYHYRVAGQDMTDPSLHRNIPLVRRFYGVEFTFHRIGFRLEANELLARHRVNGQNVVLNQRYQQLILYIPFN